MHHIDTVLAIMDTSVSERALVATSVVDDDNASDNNND